MEIEILEMKHGDYQQVYALWQSVEGIGLDDYCDSESGIAQYLERNPGLSFIARDGEKIVGSVLCGYDGRRGYLHHLAITETYRKQGIGKVLVQRALEKLKLLGIARCHLFVFNKNKEAQEFWQKAGWTERTSFKVMSKDIDLS